MSESYTHYPNAQVTIDNLTGGITIDLKDTAIDLQQVVVRGSTSDGYHTFDELYEFRMLYHAAFVGALTGISQLLKFPNLSVKSWNHSDGEPCFGGGWFIVVTDLTGHGQISNHYEAKDWDLFEVPEVEVPPEFDGHTADDVLVRLRSYLKGGEYR